MKYLFLDLNTISLDETPDIILSKFRKLKIKPMKKKQQPQKIKGENED